MSTMRVSTREFRESAVGLVLSQGLSSRVVAEGLRIPCHTLHSWDFDQRPSSYWYGARPARAIPCKKFSTYTRQSHDGKPLGDPEEGTRPRTAVPPAERLYYGDFGMQ